MTLGHLIDRLESFGLPNSTEVYIDISEIQSEYWMFQVNMPELYDRFSIRTIKERTYDAEQTALLIIPSDKDSL